MSESFLSLHAVTKSYSGKKAVDQVSLNIPKGKIYGLLGPNGAGKTSIIRMITRITRPDEGKILFRGEPLEERHTRLTGYMPEERGLYKKMKVKEQVVYLLQLKGLSKAEARNRTDAWLAKWGISDWEKKKVSELSKGMQQKVQFISTVAHEPELLILDEPFSGLDPINTKLIESEILALKKKGITIIFSTHRMEQVEELCDYIALIDNGVVKLEDEIQATRKQFQKDIYQLEFSGDPEVIAQLPAVEVLDLREKQAKVELKSGYSAKQLMQALIDSPLELLKFELHLPRLQEIFIELVQGTGEIAKEEKEAVIHE